MKRAITLLALLALILTYGMKAQATDRCSEAKRLYNQALATTTQEEAKGIYLKALALGCNDPDVLGYIHNNLGDIAEHEGNLQTALKEYKKAEGCLPQNGTVLKNLAHILEQLGRTEEAKGYYDRLYQVKRDVSAKQIVAALSFKRHLRSIMVVAASKPSGKPVVSLPTITLYFGFDSSRLRSRSIEQLRELLKALKDPEIANHRFLLAGHTCSLGTEEYNMGLSIRRAKRVKDWLVAHGIDPDRLVVRGFGETRPIMSNRWEYTRRFNRRVETSTIGIEPVAKREIPSPQGIKAMALLKKGQDLVAMGECDKAVRLLKEACDLFTQAHDSEGVDVALQNLVLAYLCMGNLEKVRELTPEAR